MQHRIFLIFAILCASAFAEDFTAHFDRSGFNNQNYVYVDARLSLQPSLSVSDNYVCTNDQLTATASLGAQAATYVLQNGAQSASTKSNAHNAEVLSPSQNRNPDSPVLWAPSATYSSMRSYVNRPARTFAQWGTIWQNNRPGRVTYSTRYISNIQGNQPAYFEGTYDASLLLFCNTSAGLVSTDGAVNNQLSQYYTGAALSSNLAFDQPGVRSLRADFGLRECLMASEAMLDNQNDNSVDIMLNTALARTISSQPVTLTVENPYTCNLPPSNPQVSSPVAPRETVSANFTISNPARQNIPQKNLTVSTISLAQNSDFTNFRIVAPRLPFDLAPGASARINTTSTAPPSAGNYPLDIAITYATKEADCSGIAVQCSAPMQLSARVVVQQNRQYSCELSPASATIINGNSYQFTASCENAQGAPADCPVLDWATNAGALSNARTQPQRSPSSSLTVNNPQGNFVRANGSVDGNPFSCNAALRAETVSCTLSPANARIINGNSYQFTASCANSAGAATDCPVLDWATNAGALSNARTQPQRSPSSSLTVNNPQGNSLSANGTFNNVRFFCAAALSPETLSCSLFPRTARVVLNQQYSFNAACALSNNSPYSCPLLTWVSDAGRMQPQQHNTSSTLTVANEQGNYVHASGTFNGAHFNCAPVSLRPHMYCMLSPPNAIITQGNSYSFSATCFNSDNEDRAVVCPQLSWDSNAGSMSPPTTAAAPNPRSTLNVTNESGTYVQAGGTSGEVRFMCNSTLNSIGIGYLLNLAGSLSASKINPQRNEGFTITATVRNPGGDVTSPFSNSLNLTGGIVDSRAFEVQSLSRHAENVQQFQFTCPNTPTIVNFVFKADSANTVNETNERDNYAYLSVLCGPVLVCMDYV